MGWMLRSYALMASNECVWVHFSFVILHCPPLVLKSYQLSFTIFCSFFFWILAELITFWAYMTFLSRTIGDSTLTKDVNEPHWPIGPLAWPTKSRLMGWSGQMLANWASRAGTCCLPSFRWIDPNGIVGCTIELCRHTAIIHDDDLSKYPRLVYL
jgi:hypothetical protein